MDRFQRRGHHGGGRLSRMADETGNVYGELTVLGLAPDPRPGRYWHCLCSCRRTAVVSTSNLRRGATKSCGLDHPRGYRTMHARYHSRLGSASDYACTAIGCVARAEHNAVLPVASRAPYLRLARRGDAGSSPVTDDLSMVAPLCRDHHGDLDKRWLVVRVVDRRWPDVVVEALWVRSGGQRLAAGSIVPAVGDERL